MSDKESLCARWTSHKLNRRLSENRECWEYVCVGVGQRAFCCSAICDTILHSIAFSLLNLDVTLSRSEWSLRQTSSFRSCFQVVGILFHSQYAWQLPVYEKIQSHLAKPWRKYIRKCLMICKVWRCGLHLCAACDWCFLNRSQTETEWDV